MHHKLTQTFSLSAVAVAVLLGGCRSDDQHEFAMPAHRAGTVTVVDALTETQVWSQEIPPGHRLVVNFERKGIVHDDELFLTKATPADVLHWTLYAPDKAFVVDGRPWALAKSSGKVKLSGVPKMGYEVRSMRSPGGAVAPTIVPDRPVPADAGTDGPAFAPDEPAPAMAPAEEPLQADEPVVPQPEAEVPVPAPAAETPTEPGAATETPVAPADDPAFK